MAYISHIHLEETATQPIDIIINKEKYDYVLLYNQYRGKDHSLILLKKC